MRSITIHPPGDGPYLHADIALNNRHARAVAPLPNGGMHPPTQNATLLVARGWRHWTLCDDEEELEPTASQLMCGVCKTPPATVKPRTPHVTEIHGDVFRIAAPPSSLGHCVSRDLRMCRGIAPDFTSESGGIQELRDQELEVGQTGSLLRNGRFIYYMVTKARCFDTPRPQDIRSALSSLRIQAENHSVPQITLPHIACGQDGCTSEVIRSIIM